MVVDLIAVVAFSCGDGSRNNSGSENGGTGTTSSEGRDEGDMNEKNNMQNDDERMNEQDTSGQMRTDTVGTSSSVSGPRRNKDGQDNSARDY